MVRLPSVAVSDLTASAQDADALGFVRNVSETGMSCLRPKPTQSLCGAVIRSSHTTTTRSYPARGLSVCCFQSPKPTALMRVDTRTRGEPSSSCTALHYINLALLGFRL